MLPEWLTIKPATDKKYGMIKRELASRRLSTVCIGAHCPNMSECWSLGTATFQVLGATCTRGCRFCAEKKGKIGDNVDAGEPQRLAEAVRDFKLSYVVLTSVCRDDLEDQGSRHFADCISTIKKINPDTVVEVLIPDFSGDTKLIRNIIDAKPDVIGHNLETVERLTSKVRDTRASYSQSLDVLRAVKQLDSGRHTKSSIMLGFGETEQDIISTLIDLRDADVDIVTMGQYLRPTNSQIEVSEYVEPQRFEELKAQAQRLGFLYVASGPFVRSSYKAGEYFAKSLVKK